MSYLDRIKKIKWISPKETEFELFFIKDYKYSLKHIGDVYENAGVGGSIFYDEGVAGKNIPLTVKFIGDDHDIEADKFEQAFCEIGKSKLQLPFGSEITVNAISLERSYSINNEVSATIFKVVFHEIDDNIYPSTKKSEKLAILNKNTELNAKNALVYSRWADKLSDMTASFNDNLSFATNLFSNIKSGNYSAVLSDIQAQVFSNNPNILANQIGVLFDEGFKAIDNYKGITNIIGAILANTAGKTDESLAEVLANDFFCKTALISASSRLLEADSYDTSTKIFETRKQAIEATEAITKIFNDYKNYIEDRQNLKSSESLETSFSQEVLIDSSIREFTGYLINLSFELKTEQTVLLDEPTNAVDFCYRFYADKFKENPEDTIDYLAKTNNFKDKDFFYLEKGRSLTIYV